MTILRQLKTVDLLVWAECRASTTTMYIPGLKYSHTGTTRCPGSLDQLIASGAVLWSVPHPPFLLYILYLTLCSTLSLSSMNIVIVFLHTVAKGYYRTVTGIYVLSMLIDNFDKGY